MPLSLLTPYPLTNRTDTAGQAVKYSLVSASESASGNPLEERLTFLNVTGFIELSTSTDSALSPSVYAPYGHVDLAPAGLTGEFALLIDKWTRETSFHSSLSKKFTHPAYQRIMAMGTEGLPLVLNELQKGNGQWFYALKYMAGKDIAQGLDDFNTAREAWLKWGYENNYL